MNGAPALLFVSFALCSSKCKCLFFFSVLWYKSYAPQKRILRTKHILLSPTLCSKASDTSKTFIVPKVFILRNSDWFHLKAYNLPFIHAKFHSTGSSSSASIKFWKFMKFPGILPKNCIVKLFYINEPLKFLHVLSSNHQIGREWLVFHPSFSYDLICQYFGEN